MSRILTILALLPLAAVMGLLAACAGDTGTTPSAANTPAASPTPPPPTSSFSPPGPVITPVSPVSPKPSSLPVLEIITPSAAFMYIKENEANSNFVIIDVRTPSEYSEDHLESATLIDFRAEGFAENISSLDRDRAYLIYCRTGVRSGNALKVMKDKGFTKVYDLAGGITAWKEAKLPTVR